MTDRIEPGMSTAEPTKTGEGVSRREFLRVGGLGMVGLSLGEQSPLSRLACTHRRRVILIVMAGGPSQLETFDPKPEAPASIRGPCKAISTTVPGVFLSETLPLLAQRLHRCALVRSLCHDYAPIHETGQQLLQTGRVAWRGVRFPHVGSVVAQALEGKHVGPVNVVLPHRLRHTGVHGECGQSSGSLGPEWDLVELNGEGCSHLPEEARRLYGDTAFGRLLYQARHLLEHGSRCITVNLFDRLQEQPTWDCHADPACAPSTLCDYRDWLCPQFDRALAGLLDDLEQCGLLQDTLVIATGEMGRTPRVNVRGGRDHWTRCWSALLAGGGLTGGAVLGASDHHAAEPIDKPLSPAQLPATILAWFGLDGQKATATLHDQNWPLIPAAPLTELWS